MNTRIEGNRIIACPDGKITTNNSHEIEIELYKILENAEGRELVIDASNVEYVSSSGLRVFYKISSDLDSPLTIFNVGPDLYTILDMTGFTTLLNVERKMKTIDISGCEVIGKGAVGTVYRLDDDNVVKVYDSPDCLDGIVNERNLARQAFIKGVPTAISYEIVKVGAGYGSVFELIRAKSMNDILVNDPDKIASVSEEYVNLLKKVHEVEVKPGDFPSAKELFIGYIDTLKTVIPDDLAGAIKDKINAMTDDYHVVHGDPHLKNVMLTDDEPLFIDMDSISTGDPLFDLQALFVAYRAYNEDEPDNSIRFMGLSDGVCDDLWNRILHLYFEGKTQEEIRFQEDKIKLLGYIRFLDRVVTAGMTRPELKELRIRHTVEQLTLLINKVDSLNTH